MLLPQGIERLTEGDEIAGDQPGALMDQLIERMLAVGAGLTPINGASVAGDGVAIAANFPRPGPEGSSVRHCPG